MPDLPTITVTQDQYDLIMEAYGSDFHMNPGGVGVAEDVYISHVRSLVKNVVVQIKMEQITQVHDSARDTELNQVYSEVNTIFNA